MFKAFFINENPLRKKSGGFCLYLPHSLTDGSSTPYELKSKDHDRAELSLFRNADYSSAHFNSLAWSLPIHQVRSSGLCVPLKIFVGFLCCSVLRCYSFGAVLLGKMFRFDSVLFWSAT